MIVEIRPDKLSCLVEIDGRVNVWGRKKIKLVSKFKVGVLDLYLEKGEEEVGVSVNLDNSSPQVQVQSSLRRPICLIEKGEQCKSASSFSLSSGSQADIGRQHIPTLCPVRSWHVLQRQNRQRKVGRLEVNGQVTRHLQCFSNPLRKCANANRQQWH